MKDANSREFLCFAMFALFLEIGAITRPQDLWPFSIHFGNRAEISHMNPRRKWSQREPGHAARSAWLM